MFLYFSPGVHELDPTTDFRNPRAKSQTVTYLIFLAYSPKSYFYNQLKQSLYVYLSHFYKVYIYLTHCVGIFFYNSYEV